MDEMVSLGLSSKRNTITIASKLCSPGRKQEDQGRRSTDEGKHKSNILRTSTNIDEASSEVRDPETEYQGDNHSATSP
jgi:hypothetical protein